MFRVTLVLLAVAAAVISDTCDYSENCNSEEKRMLQVTCPQGAGAGRCSCDGKSENTGLNSVECADETGITDLVASVTVETMKFSWCKTLCEAATVTPCKFYKWELVNIFIDQEKNIIFLLFDV